jgi:hypothetical protein
VRAAIPAVNSASCRAVASAATGDLVKSANCQSALRQVLVNRPNAEWQHSPWTRSSPFDAECVHEAR